LLLLHRHAVQLLHLKLDIRDSSPQLEAVAVLAAIWQLQNQLTVLTLFQLLLALPFLSLPVTAAVSVRMPEGVVTRSVLAFERFTNQSQEPEWAQQGQH
jgi:hypothetical protein